MEKLFEKVHSTQVVIENTVNEIVELVVSDIEDKEFTLDELNAMASMILSKMNSQLSYSLFSKLIWMAKESK